MLGVRRAAGTVFAHFEQRARHIPEQIALHDPITDARLNYGELLRQATHLAHVLAGQGCHAGTVVGLCLERSPEAIIAILAILKQGAAYLPLDPAWPAARVRFVLTVTRARFVITHAALSEPFLSLPDVKVLIQDHLDHPSDLSADVALTGKNRQCEQFIGDDALACMLPTAGITGPCRVVGLSQRSLLRQAHLHERLTIHPTDRVAQVMPLSSYPALWEVWVTLLSGATLVLLPASLLHAPVALAAALQTHRITTLYLPTTLFHRIVRTVPSTFASLDTLLVGDDAVATHVVQQLWLHDPPRRLMHVYGQAETGGIRLLFEVNDPATITSATLPLGEPVNAITATIIDQKGQQIEQAGQTGELVLSGEDLAVGYPGYPDLTAAAFGNPAHGGYRTGDLVRWRVADDGGRVLSWVGRREEVREVSAQGVPCADLEALLSQHPALLEVAFVPCGSPEQPTLAVFLVPSVHPLKLRWLHLLQQELGKRLQRVFPWLHLPVPLFVCATLPLTVMGHLDRERLRMCCQSHLGPAQQVDSLFLEVHDVNR
jgi:non-ribosomal peptide synthetase component F